MIDKVSKSAVIAVMLSFSSPVFAQDLQVDADAIAKSIEVACAVSAEECELAVAAAIETLAAAGIVGDALDVQLGVIGVAAVTGSASLPPAEKLKLAKTFTAISSVTTNPAQKAAFAEAAASFEAGISQDVAEIASTLSPN